MENKIYIELPESYIVKTNMYERSDFNIKFIALFNEHHSLEINRKYISFKNNILDETFDDDEWEDENDGQLPIFSLDRWYELYSKSITIENDKHKKEDQKNSADSMRELARSIKKPVEIEQIMRLILEESKKGNNYLCNVYSLSINTIDYLLKMGYGCERIKLNEYMISW